MPNKKLFLNVLLITFIFFAFQNPLIDLLSKRSDLITAFFSMLVIKSLSAKVFILQDHYIVGNLVFNGGQEGQEVQESDSQEIFAHKYFSH